MSNALRDCPGCEGEDVQVAEWMAGGMTEVAYVRCSDCGMTGPHVEVVKADVEAAKAEAEARWNALPRERAWIPVAERLPEAASERTPFSATVLVFRLGRSGPWVGYRDHRVRQWYSPGGERLADVTHWMPLPPPPPKREEAADA